MNKKSTPVIGVIVAIAVIIVAMFGSTYNGLNNSKNNVDAAWAQVENVMQRRADLIPNLVSSVKGQMAHEQKIVDSVTDARAAFNKAATPNEKLKADDNLQEQTNVLVNAIQENYPDLSSSESVQTLMTQLEGSENRISVERRRYIEAVTDYNKKVTSFPTNMTAGMMGFQKIDQYKATTPGADKAPTVDLGQ